MIHILIITNKTNLTRINNVGNQSTRLLVHTMIISCLNYYNALLAGLPACAAKPLQMVQNVATCLLFNQPKMSPLCLLSYTGYARSCSQQIQITNASLQGT